MGTRSMESRVWSQKILLIHHMARLQEGDLAKMMMEEQMKYNWPGLSLEVAGLCRELGLEDAARTKMDKIEYKKEVEKGCRFKDEKNMKEEMERMRDKKMRRMIKEDCDLKDYVKYGNIYSARKSWEAKCYMLRVAGNYPGHKRYKASGWRCQA